VHVDIEVRAQRGDELLYVDASTAVDLGWPLPREYGDAHGPEH
jgi:hypothetical protein